MVDQGENDLENLMLCHWKRMSVDPDSTTFKQVRDETHSLYKCYSCLGVGVNTCDDYKPRLRLDRVIGDYR